MAQQETNNNKRIFLEALVSSKKHLYVSKAFRTQQETRRVQHQKSKPEKSKPSRPWWPQGYKKIFLFLRKCRRLGGISFWRFFFFFPVFSTFFLFCFLILFWLIDIDLCFVCLFVNCVGFLVFAGTFLFYYVFVSCF